MQDHAIQDLYDAGYAQAYDERFLTGEDWSKQGSDFELEVIAELVDRPEARWLDVACGTGYYLGQFPEVERTGLDLSPGMLGTAGQNAPTASFVEGSYLEEHLEWQDHWTLVSCMWAAYAYVGSLDALDDLIANLARWTAPDGSVFLPITDVVDLSGGIDVPYRNDETWIFGGTLLVKAAIWDWHDEKLGKHHRNLLAPHTDHLVACFGRHFGRVEVVRYPPYLPGWDSRQAIVASEKRGPDDVAPTVVVRREAPPCRTVLPPAADDLAPPDEAPEGPSGDEAPAAAVEAPVAPAAPSEPPAVHQEHREHQEHQAPAIPVLGRREHLWLAFPPGLRKAVSTGRRALPARFRPSLRRPSDDGPASS